MNPIRRKLFILLAVSLALGTLATAAYPPPKPNDPLVSAIGLGMLFFMAGFLYLVQWQKHADKWGEIRQYGKTSFLAAQYFVRLALPIVVITYAIERSITKSLLDIMIFLLLAFVGGNFEWKKQEEVFLKRKKGEE